MNDFQTNKINNRQSFIEFLKVFHQDYLMNKEQWQNSNLDNFLEAMTSYTEDIQGYYDNIKQNINADEPSWQTFANILMGAKIYE
jgi:hypothetical protein